MRYSYHLERVLTTLNYCSLSFIPNLFDGDKQDLSNLPASFQLADYSNSFLVSTGGILMTLIAYFLGLWIFAYIMTKVLTIKAISWEPLLNLFEDVTEYFRYQAFVRLL